MKLSYLMLIVSLISCSGIGLHKSQRDFEHQKRLQALAKMGLYTTKDREFYNYCFILWDMIHVPEDKLKKAKYPNPKNPFEKIGIREMISHYRILRSRLPFDSDDLFARVKSVEVQVKLRKIFKEKKCSDHSV